MSTPAADAPDARLALMEKRLNRWTRLASWFATFNICFMIVGAAFFLAPTVRLAQGNYSLEANELLIRDAEGNSRMFLSVDKDGPGLHLQDRQGAHRAALGVYADGVRLSLYDGRGKAWAGLAVTSEGDPVVAIGDSRGKERSVLTILNDEPLFLLRDDQTRPRLLLAIRKEGEQRIPAVAVLSPDRKMVGTLLMSDDGPLLDLVDNDTKADVGMTVSKTAGPNLRMRDEKGRERARLIISKEGPKITLQDEDGKPLFSKP